MWHLVRRRLLRTPVKDSPAASFHPGLIESAAAEQVLACSIKLSYFWVPRPVAVHDLI